MDTVDAVLALLAFLLLSNLGTALLWLRDHHRAETAQREIVRLVELTRRVRPDCASSQIEQQRPRSLAAGYDTGLMEIEAS